MKKSILAILAGVFMLVSCGEEDNSTMEGAAKAFVVALIEADEAKIEKLNKSHAWSQPTHYLLQKLSPKFRNTSLSEYTFILSGGDKIKVIDSFRSGYEFKMLKTSEGWFFLKYSKLRN